MGFICFMDRFLTIPIFYAFSLILLELKGLNWPSKNCVKKIRNEDVRKNLRVAVEFKFFVVMSSPKSVVGIHPRHKRAGTGSGFPIKPVLERLCRVELGNDNKGAALSSALSLIEGPVLSLPKDRRVASLYLC